MLNCKEATLELERMKFEKPTVWKKLSVRIHLMMCKACTGYKADSSEIDKMLREMNKNNESFTADELEKLEQNISR